MDVLHYPVFKIQLRQIKNIRPFVCLSPRGVGRAIRRGYELEQAVGTHRKRVWSSGYDARFTRERSRVRSPLPVRFLSSSVEQLALLGVVP